MSIEKALDNGKETRWFLSLLGLLFVGLKLAHVIDWSWWYVTLPFWGGLVLATAVFLVVLPFLIVWDWATK